MTEARRPASHQVCSGDNHHKANHHKEHHHKANRHKAHHHKLQRRTMIILGASNVSLAWSEIVSLAVQSSPLPIDLVTAHGMGRAYVTASSGFAFRRLPGILHSELWNAASNLNHDQAASALITDLGNDLLYGRRVAEVTEGAIQCIQRIRECSPNADVVLTAPPLESVLSLSSMRFRFFKNVLFPFSPLDLQSVKKKTQQLFDNVQQIAVDQRVKLYEPPISMFGFDPIHVRRRFRKTVFRNIMELWDQPPRGTFKRKRFPKAVPCQRWMVGKEQRTKQPVIDTDPLRVFAY